MVDGVNLILIKNYFEFDLIPSIFQAKLLRAQITKVQKDTDDLIVFLQFCNFGILAHKSCGLRPCALIESCGYNCQL